MPRGKKNDEPQETHQQDALAPELEGLKYLGVDVEELRLKITSASALKTTDTDLRIGNVVQVVLEGVITADTHNVANRGDRDGGRQYIRKTLTFKPDSEPKITLLAESRPLEAEDPEDAA